MNKVSFGLQDFVGFLEECCSHRIFSFPILWIAGTVLSIPQESFPLHTNSLGILASTQTSLALFGSRVDHRKRIGIENRRIGKQARSSGIIPLICLGHKPPRTSRDEHEDRPDFSFPVCTVRAIPFPVDFLRKVSRETKDMLTSSIPILSYPVFALRFAREPKEALG